MEVLFLAGDLRSEVRFNLAVTEVRDNIAGSSLEPTLLYMWQGKQADMDRKLAKGSKCSLALSLCVVKQWRGSWRSEEGT